MATLFKRVLLPAATFLRFFYSTTLAISAYFTLDSTLLPFLLARFQTRRVASLL
jgi:hypothetical protein